MPFRTLPGRIWRWLAVAGRGQLRFTALVIQFAVAEFLFRCASCAFSFSISFSRRAISLPVAGFAHAAQLPDASDLYVPGAVRILFWRFVGLVFLLLYVLNHC